MSVITTAPLIAPLAPRGAANVTPSVQLAPAARFRPFEQGFAPVPTAEKSPLAAMLLKVTELPLLFLTVSDFAALAVPATSVEKLSVAGEKVKGGVPPPEPVPESPISWGENPAASVMLTAPLTLPLLVGEKVTAILHFAPAASDDPQVVPVELIA